MDAGTPGTRASPGRGGATAPSRHRPPGSKVTLPSHSPRPLSRPCSWPCLAFRASLSGLPGPDPVASRLGSPGSAGPSRAAVPARRPFPVQEFRQEVTKVCCIESRSVTWSRAPRDGGRFLCLPGPPGLTSLCLHLEARPGPWRPPHPVATRSPGQAPLTPRPWGDGPHLPPGCDEQRPPAPPHYHRSRLRPRCLPATARVPRPAHLCHWPWAGPHLPATILAASPF